MNMVIQEPDRKESQLKRIQREKRDVSSVASRAALLAEPNNEAYRT